MRTLFYITHSVLSKRLSRLCFLSAGLIIFTLRASQVPSRLTAGLSRVTQRDVTHNNYVITWRVDQQQSKSYRIVFFVIYTARDGITRQQTCMLTLKISWTASSVQGKCYQLFCTVLLCCYFFVDFYLLRNHLFKKEPDNGNSNHSLILPFWVVEWICACLHVGTLC